MLIPILGSVLTLSIVLFIALIRNGSKNKEQEAEDIPGCDYDYGEPPYNSYKYN